MKYVTVSIFLRNCVWTNVLIYCWVVYTYFKRKGTCGITSMRKHLFRRTDKIIWDGIIRKYLHMHNTFTICRYPLICILNWALRGKRRERLEEIYNRKLVYEQIELFMCLGVILHWCVWVLACQTQSEYWSVISFRPFTHIGCFSIS